MLRGQLICWAEAQDFIELLQRLQPAAEMQLHLRCVGTRQCALLLRFCVATQFRDGFGEIAMQSRIVRDRVLEICKHSSCRSDD